MRLAPARQAAFGALAAVDRGSWSAESVATKVALLEPRDAALASEIAFGVLRRQGELDAAIAALSNRPVDRLDSAVRIALEMGLYQLRFLDRVPAHATVSDSVELARRAGKSSAGAFVNAILRRASRDKIVTDERLSTPSWFFHRWAAQYGRATAECIAKASLARPERYIRVPPGSPPPGGAEPAEIPGCFRLDSGDPGPYRFQDIGSQAVVPLLDLHSGQSFLDVCAAPGNKTAQALESGVRAIACELHPSRAKTLLPLGIPVVVIDARAPLPFSSKFGRGLFDRILVDAPCSGTGTLARNPEIKWRLKPEDIRDLHGRQVAILLNALAAAKEDGLVVYSTCSLEREENEDVVAEAVAASGAAVERAMERIPGRDPGDGFFAAVLRPKAGGANPLP